MPYFAEHFQIESGALLQALRLHQLALADKLLQPVRQFNLDGLHRRQHLLARGDVMAAGVHGETRYFLPDAPGQRVKQLQGLNLIVKQLNAYGHLAVFSREHVNGVAAHPKLAA